MSRRYQAEFQLSQSEHQQRADVESQLDQIEAQWPGHLKVASDYSSGCPVPDTAATGRIFHDLDCSGLTSDEFQEHRQKVVEPGQREGWLLDPNGVQLQLGQLLGSGGFGIVHVCSGG